MLGFWFVEQALFGAAPVAHPGGGGGGVAYFAHIGGFAFGLLAIRVVRAAAQAAGAAPPAIPAWS